MATSSPRYQTLYLISSVSLCETAPVLGWRVDRRPNLAGNTTDARNTTSSRKEKKAAITRFSRKVIVQASFFHYIFATIGSVQAERTYSIQATAVSLRDNRPVQAGANPETAPCLESYWHNESEPEQKEPAARVLARCLRSCPRQDQPIFPKESTCSAPPDFPAYWL